MPEIRPEHVPSPRTSLGWDGTRYRALGMDAAGNLRVVLLGRGIGMYEAYVHVQDQKPQNTPGGGFTLGAWRTRDINVELDDTATICAIAANQITLQPGTYRCLITCPAYKVSGHQARLQNITGVATLLTGTSEYTDATDNTCTRSVISGRFTLAVASVLEIQHQSIASQAGNGFGPQANFTTEVYTDAEFWREW